MITDVTSFLIGCGVGAGLLLAVAALWLVMFTGGFE